MSFDDCLVAVKDPLPPYVVNDGSIALLLVNGTVRKVLVPGRYYRGWGVNVLGIRELVQLGTTQEQVRTTVQGVQLAGEVKAVDVPLHSTESSASFLRRVAGVVDVEVTVVVRTVPEALTQLKRVPHDFRRDTFADHVHTSVEEAVDQLVRAYFADRAYSSVLQDGGHAAALLPAPLPLLDGLVEIVSARRVQPMQDPHAEAVLQKLRDIEVQVLENGRLVLEQQGEAIAAAERERIRVQAAGEIAGDLGKTPFEIAFPELAAQKELQQAELVKQLLAHPDLLAIMKKQPDLLTSLRAAPATPEPEPVPPPPQDVKPAAAVTGFRLAPHPQIGRVLRQHRLGDLVRGVAADWVSPTDRTSQEIIVVTTDPAAVEALLPALAEQVERELRFDSTEWHVVPHVPTLSAQVEAVFTALARPEQYDVERLTVRSATGDDVCLQVELAVEGEPYRAQDLHEALLKRSSLVAALFNYQELAIHLVQE